MSSEEIPERPALVRCRMANPRTDNKGYTTGEPVYLGQEAVRIDIKEATVNHVFSQTVPDEEAVGPLVSEGKAYFKIVAIDKDGAPLVQRLTPQQARIELARIKAEQEAIKITEERSARERELTVAKEKRRKDSRQRRLREDGVLPATPAQIEKETRILKNNIKEVFGLECGYLLPKVVTILNKYGIQIATSPVLIEDYLKEIIPTITSFSFYNMDQLTAEETKILEYFRYIAEDIRSLLEQPTEPFESEHPSVRYYLRGVIDDARLISDSRFNIQLSEQNISVPPNQERLIIRIISLLQRAGILKPQSFFKAAKYSSGELQIEFEAIESHPINMASIPMLICKRAARQVKDASFFRDDTLKLTFRGKQETGGFGRTAHL